MADRTKGPPGPPEDEKSGPRPREGTMLAAAGRHDQRVVQERAHPFYCTSADCPGNNRDLSREEGELLYCPYCGKPLEVTDDPAQHGLRVVRRPIMVGASISAPTAPPATGDAAPLAPAQSAATPTVATSGAPVHVRAAVPGGTLEVKYTPEHQPPAPPKADQPAPPPAREPSSPRPAAQRRESATVMQYRQDPAKWNAVIAGTFMFILVIVFMAHAYVQRRDARATVIELNDGGSVFVSVPTDASND